MTILKAQIPSLRKTISVRNPFDGEIVASIEATAPEETPAVIARAEVGFKLAKALPRHRRAAILSGAAEAVRSKSTSFAGLIVREAGKTIAQARKEVARCVNTLTLSADEARRNAGELIAFDAYEGSENREGWFRREPLGIIAAITPYNDPLNLVAHKLGPAIAGGNSVILKPSELAPLSAIWLVDELVAAGLPEEVITVAIGGPDLGRTIVSARSVRMVSFTGGFSTGEAITRQAGLKKMAMDLGGNAPVIVMADCSFDYAVQSCVSGAFWAAGQNCIGTQRILIESSLYSRFRDAFVSQSKTMICGDPMSEATNLGPMISDAAAARAERIVSEAVADGAVLLCGGKRKGTLFPATVLERVPNRCRVWTDEVFAPIVVLQTFETIEDAIAMANSSEFSLHAGVFTSSLAVSTKVANEVEAGGVMINDSSDYRFDAMPFGGFKYGSMGREGVRFAYEEMTQPKVVCINRV